MNGEQEARDFGFVILRGSMANILENIGRKCARNLLSRRLPICAVDEALVIVTEWCIITITMIVNDGSLYLWLKKDKTLPGWAACLRDFEQKDL
jgi:hypothetical protein